MALTAHDDVYFPGGYTPPGTKPIQTPMPESFAPPIVPPMPGDPSYYRPKPPSLPNFTPPTPGGTPYYPGTPYIPGPQMKQIPDNIWGFFMLMMGL